MATDRQTDRTRHHLTPHSNYVCEAGLSKRLTHLEPVRRCNMLYEKAYCVIVYDIVSRSGLSDTVRWSSATSRIADVYTGRLQLASCVSSQLRWWLRAGRSSITRGLSLHVAVQLDTRWTVAGVLPSVLLGFQSCFVILLYLLRLGSSRSEQNIGQRVVSIWHGRWSYLSRHSSQHPVCPNLLSVCLVMSSSVFRPSSCHLLVSILWPD